MPLGDQSRSLCISPKFLTEYLNVIEVSGLNLASANSPGKK